MPKTYEGLGFSLLLPDNWVVEDEPEADAVSIESPEGAFLTIRRLESVAEEAAALKQAEQAMIAEYDGIEREDFEKFVEGLQFNGITQRFVCLDMIVTSQLMTFHAGAVAYLAQIQAEDRDMDRLQLVFDAMLTSLCKSLQSSE